ncbi:MAG: site-specific integrase [Lachnospiraceae bacterium]|nr:site-specific integrase [Lachnospiraceae bacterium]MCM1239368.1 site-specific integrase [Lachnospiraceae bacterium]
MASIQKRGKKYSVVYTYEDQDGQKRQKWETFDTKAEARTRKAAVENEMNSGTFIPPSTATVESFLKDFVELYGTKRWGLSVYATNNALISNYINPLIGSLLVQDVNRRTVDHFIQQLQKTPAVSTPYRHAKTEFVTPCTIEKVMKLMRCAFHQAVRWDMVGKNPFEDADLPKREKHVRAIWTADTIRKALDSCEDGKLYVAINLAFACSMRLGEITGLTWDCLHISEAEIAADNAYVWIEKELARVDQKAIDALGEKDILYVFPRVMGGKSSTRLVLKKPKTESSVRKVWIPKTLACILCDWREKQNKLKELMGPDYTDYNLVLAQETGRPCEDRIIGNQFERLKKSAGLPDVVFHSLRHSSTTYKLKLNKGDLKATQGDTGHAQIDMITDIYAHILDEDRKINAQKFETAFYANPDMRPVEQKLQGSPQQAVPDPSAMMEQLQSEPGLMEDFTKQFVEKFGEQIMAQFAKKMMGS